MGESASTNTPATRWALDRHQRRRGQGVPTLSVLVGPEEAAVAAWEGWVFSMGWQPTRVANWTGREIDASAGVALFVGGTSTEDTRKRARDLSRAVTRLGQLLAMATTDTASTAWAISVRREDATTFLRENAETRAGALFIEGMIELLPPPTPSPAKPLPPVETPDAGAAVSLLTRLGASPATTERFQTAAASCQQTDGDENEDRARSEAERFLFQLLSDLPDTAGLFELNVRLGFCFGPMPAEVDLLASTLGLAVEIDGFHHFRDPVNYRRDRRKDTLLQKQGYLVLRFLATDVVTHLEDILEEIRAAVAFRRATR